MLIHMDWMPSCCKAVSAMPAAVGQAAAPAHSPCSKEVTSPGSPLQEAAQAQQGSSDPCTGLGTSLVSPLWPLWPPSTPPNHRQLPTATDSHMGPPTLPSASCSFHLFPLSREPPPLPALHISATQSPHIPLGAAAQSQAAPVTIAQEQGMFITK